MNRPIIGIALSTILVMAACKPFAGDEFNDQAVLLGSMNVYDPSLTTFEPAAIYAVRIIEGLTDEGMPDEFGLSDHKGAALLGRALVREDGSWAAMVPANAPVRCQLIDKFGMSIRNEPVWISGKAGETRFCIGCHESRTSTTVIRPGITQALAIGPEDLMSNVERSSRMSTNYTMDNVVGVPWDLALQPIFDAKCISCHDGTPNAANPTYTITHPESGDSETFTFDLRGQTAQYGFGDKVMRGYSASHLSLLGPDIAGLENAGLVVTGDLRHYVEPTSARDSILIQKLNPHQTFPTIDTTVHAFATLPHPEDIGGQALTPDEYLVLILAADMGGQFYSRENAPGTDQLDR